MIRRFLLTSMVLAVVAVGPVQAAGKVTLENLLRQMTDLSLLAEFPDPPYVARQFSSYDRNSEDSQKTETWFANADRGFMLYDGVLKEKTPYYKSGPAREQAPDGHFEAGTRVGIAPTHPAVGPYIWVYATAADGRPINGKIVQGYVNKKALTMDPQGHVLAEMDGPGCVTRIWSANPQDTGKIRIFLDGAAEPALEAPLTALLTGKWKTTIDGKEVTPFPDPIACERAQGYTLYFPIAYQKHCKITLTGPDVYYHVDYRMYPKGTEVETFTLASLIKAEKRMEEVAATLKNPSEYMRSGGPLGGPEDADHTMLEGFSVRGFEVEPGQKIGPYVCNTQKAFARFFIGFHAPVDEATLRSLVVVMTFDGSAQPQVWCPVCDFFGSGVGGRPCRSLPFRVNNNQNLDTLCWMPFEKKAVFEMRNLGTKKVSLQVGIGTCPYKWTDRSMHFHAKYRTQTMNTRPFRDWTYCDLKGKGVFVGDSLAVFNPVSAWWGEGDEKIYVDGEKFPSWFGTGTEDYYSYAWCSPRLFQHAYHNQVRCDGPGNRGHTTVNRFHILDAIPFEKSFKFDMEVWHWVPNIDVAYSAVSYWYARPGGTDDFKQVDAKTLQNIPHVPPPFKLAGAIEGEALQVLKKSSDFPLDPQAMAEYVHGTHRWSGESHLWGRPPRQGEWADLALPVAADGKYHVIVYLTRARDYGIVQFHLDGKLLGKPIDGFHADTVIGTGPIDLGEVDLKKGTATLRVEVVGTNPKSDGMRTMWGLDCIVLKSVAP